MSKTPKRKTAMNFIGLCFVLFSITNMLYAQGNEILPLSSHNKQPLRLTIVERDQTKLIRPSEGAYYFTETLIKGTVPTQHSFFLKNLNSGPIILDRLQPSCGCTSAVVADKQSSSFPTSLAPGQQIRIDVAVNTDNFSVGKFHKSVQVFIHGQDEPAAVIEMFGDLQPILSTTPKILDFGQTRTIQSKSLLLSVFYNPQLLPQNAQLRVVSSLNGINITQETALPSEQTATNTTLKFRVAITPHVPLGLIAGSVLITSVVTGEPAYSETASVPLQGEVLGEAIATPSIVAFGAVHLVGVSGRALARQQVVITSRSRTSLKDLVVSAGPNVSVDTIPLIGDSLSPAQKDGSVAPSKLLLTITIKTQTPPGALESYVNLTSANGEKLVLPVSAYVINSN